MIHHASVNGCVQERPATQRERRLGILFSAVAFFFGYVLSAGPAVFLVEHLDLPMVGAIVQVLYAPLVFLVKSDLPVIAPAIKAWVELFR